MGRRYLRFGGGYKKLLKTQRWLNLAEIWRGKSDVVLPTGAGGIFMVHSAPQFLVPYAPSDKAEWTEELTNIIYPLLELALGHRRELTESEMKDREILEEVEEIDVMNDPDWLKKTLAVLNEDADVPFGVEQTLAQQLEDAVMQEYGD